MGFNKKSSWAFLNPTFWASVCGSLAISALAKFLVNLLIPPYDPRSAEISWVFPSPPGRFAITHAEHWHDGWPDYTEGIIGAAATKLAVLLEKFVEHDNTELWIWLAGWIILIFWLSLWTSGENREAMLFGYIGLGLLIAGGVSNEVEIALFGHSTDFIFFRLRESSQSFHILNLADVMLALGMALGFLVFPVYSRWKRQAHEGLSER